MKQNTITIAITLLLAALWLPAHAQSVKDIINDKTGQYIYSQARDEDSQSALSLASDELVSRVESYIGANKMKKYNHNWKEWVKRIINEKYGRTRVFLYVSVNDLKPEAEAMTAPKQDYIGSSSSVEKTPVKTEVHPTPQPTEEIPEEIVTTESVETLVTEEGIKTEETITQEETIESDTDNQQPLPDGLLGDVITRIIDEGVRGDIASQLSRGKNMKVISMYGENTSKYLPHAYVITNDNGKLRLYTPQDKEGKRTDLTDKEAPTNMSGKMMYWFLKK